MAMERPGKPSFGLESPTFDVGLANAITSQDVGAYYFKFHVWLNPIGTHPCTPLSH